jgi:putative NADPH-quinone reductase
MQTLVVHAHPDPASFNGALFVQVCATLRAQGHAVDTIDLYAEQFDPVMRLHEKQAYLETPDWLLAPYALHIDKLQRCEHLVFVHPTWWWGPPAILKGWLEKVWLPKITFEPAVKKGERLKPKMQHIKRITVITHGGSPWWWLKVIGDPHRKFFFNGMRMLFAKNCKTCWLQLHDMNNATHDDRTRFIAKVERSLSKLPI